MQIGNRTYYSKDNYSEVSGCFNNVVYYKNGKVFRKTGPSEIFSDSSGRLCYWSKNIELHRIDGPAIFDADYKRWFIKNKGFFEEYYWNK